VLENEQQLRDLTQEMRSQMREMELMLRGDNPF